MKGYSRKPVRPAREAEELALQVVDNVPLRKTAWERLGLARKRLAKATADLHRHEQEDELAYRRWMFASCPTLLSEIRDLTIQCQGKASLIAKVEARARREGRPPAMIWQLYKDQLIRGGEFVPEEDEEFSEDDEFDQADEMDQTEKDQIMDEFLRDEGIDPLSPEAEKMRDLGKLLRRHDSPEPSGEAKEVYRRLVQRLHPDRGGEWSSQREALWHEVQRAWEARDADWLARLEAEYEITAESLTLESGLGRLSAALAGIEAARRDTERKLRRYRKTPAWRFTLEQRQPGEVEKLVASCTAERDQLRIHLANLEATFVRWEKPLGLARAKQRNAVTPEALAQASQPLPNGRDRLGKGRDR